MFLKEIQKRKFKSWTIKFCDILNVNFFPPRVAGILCIIFVMIVGLQNYGLEAVCGRTRTVSFTWPDHVCMWYIIISSSRYPSTVGAVAADITCQERTTRRRRHSIDQEINGINGPPPPPRHRPSPMTPRLRGCQTHAIKTRAHENKVHNNGTIIVWALFAKTHFLSLNLNAGPLIRLDPWTPITRQPI